MIIFLLQAYFLFHDVQLIRANGGGPVDLFPYPTTGRLPTWIKPIHYNLSLEVYLESASYNGSVGIDFEVVNTTDKIVLSMLDIVTNNDTCKVVMTSELEDMPIKKQSYDYQLQFYVIHLGRVLQAGETGSVSVDFRGTLNSILVGFYLSTYKNSNGETIRVASTQFSPTDARRAFPCFDEPGFKATFDISIERDNKTKSLSNMPLMETSATIGKEQRFLDRFERTLKMSTYLVGFLVSDFEYRSSNALNETEFKVWSRKEALNQTSYALDVGPKLLQYLENYFGTKYPLPKLDMAAIPNFKFRGMENWGLIMYRESAVLFDPQVSNIESKRNIIQVIAHEIAHMWFGNLVTPKWWSELWLKEGFANFMGYKAVDDKEPSWRMMDYLVQTSNFEAFDKDSLRSSHPINVHVDHPDRISEIFDEISYQKGACLIRMMEQFLTEPIFKQGMQSYIHDLKFDNAEQQDLWRFLNQAWETSDLYSPERTVEVIMNTWTLQDGFPVVTVNRNNSDIYLTQERFLLQENEIPSNSSIPEYMNRKWWIPISFVKESSSNFTTTQPKVWMPPTEDPVTFSEVMDENEWFLLNVQKTAFYRVNYDTNNWNLLTQQLSTDHEGIHNLNRAQILDDSWNLARTGLVDYYIPMNMTLYIKDERDLTVWKMFAENYDYVYRMAKTTSNITYFDDYFRELIIPLYNATGFLDSSALSYQMQTLTSLATKWACRVGYEPCVETSLSLFNQWLELPDKDSSELIPSNVKATVLCEGIKNASPEVWNQTFEIYLNSNVQTEKANILAALACTKNVEILERYLNMSLDPSSGILKQDSPTVFQNVASSKDGRDLAWATVKGNWRYIYQYFGSGSFYLKSIIGSVAKTFNTEILVKEFEEFSETQKDYLGSSRQGAKNALELAVINTQWMKNRYPQALKYMSEN